jgi:hypothetical protein
MSTFYGGPQLTSITSVSGSQGAGSLYTVPSGFFAVISGSVTATVLPGSGNRGGLTVAGVDLAVLGDSTTQFRAEFSQVTVPSGTTISRINTAGGGGTTCSYQFYVGIQLYKNP